MHDLQCRRARLDDVAVEYGSAFVFDGIAVRDDVLGTGGAGEFESTGCVVVVYVSFESLSACGEGREATDRHERKRVSTST